tara:strand:+ start:1060 stop:2187 length:1128 start_codon:yes stop_codon:yes gene_type:complete
MNKENQMFWTNHLVTLHLAKAKSLPIEDKSVHTVVTSPPYWGLRDYGTATWEGGDEECDHTVSHWSDNLKPHVDRPFRGDRSSCLKCGAKRIDLQIGLETTPEEYCASMVAVFREVRRVLRDDGTVWLNLGDSYSSGSRTTTTNDSFRGDTLVNTTRTPVVKGIKPKDLVGIPWRVAFALQEDGWYLRSDIIWSKPNPMPESVTDRPTKAHEYVFLLTKQAKYYYDADAIRETNGKESSWDNYGGKGFINHPTGDARHQVDLAEGMSQRMVKPNTTHPNGRNKRSVWEISTQPYAEAHFATYPEKLVEPCILAGCPAGGTVLDPFVGSGTTLAVAQRLGRKGVGTDINDEYLKLAKQRLEKIALPMNMSRYSELS